MSIKMYCFVNKTTEHTLNVVYLKEKLMNYYKTKKHTDNKIKLLELSQYIQFVYVLQLRYTLCKFKDIAHQLHSTVIIKTGIKYYEGY